MKSDQLVEEENWVDEAMELFDDDYNASIIIEHEWEYIENGEEEDDCELYGDL
jgi:hypothetical protein